MTGDLYIPSKRRLQAYIVPGSDFIAVIKDDQIILSKRKNYFIRSITISLIIFLKEKVFSNNSIEGG